MDELDHEGDGGESSSSGEEDQMDVDNPIHKGPLAVEGLEVLGVVAPTLGRINVSL